MPAPDHLGGQPPLLAARALAVANRLAPLDLAWPGGPAGGLLGPNG
ncbi:ATP-binding cassette domain-containing protein, partial [Aeromonas hydrophila]